MTNEWLNVFLLIGLFLILFSIGEILFRIVKLKVEITRKFIHLSCGLLTLLFPVLLHEIWQVAFISTSFLLLLALSFKWNILPSINNVTRKTIGSILFPISILICFIAFHYIEKAPGPAFSPYAYFYVPVTVLAISDPLAALCGKHWGRSPGEGKTNAGSAAFWVSAFIICLLMAHTYALASQHLLLFTGAYAIVAASTGTLMERISKMGWDNITIPVSLICISRAAELLITGLY